MSSVKLITLLQLFNLSKSSEEQNLALFPTNATTKNNGKENFLGWNMMTTKVLSARFVRKGGSHLRELVELGLQSLLTVGRRL